MDEGRESQQAIVPSKTVNGSKESFTGYHTPVMEYMPRENLPSAELGVKVMDQETYKLIQIEDLYKAVDFTHTRIGALTLKRSLTQPLTSAEVISAKQDSLRELMENPQLKQDLTEYAAAAAQSEERLYDYFQGNYGRQFNPMSLSSDIKPNMYTTFKGAHQFLRHLGNGTSRIEASSEYLKFLLSNLEEYRNSKVFGFIKGPVYKTKHGLRTKEDAHIFTPSIKFRPTDFTLGRVLTSAIAGVGMMGIGTTVAIESGRRFDDIQFVTALRQLYFSDQHVTEAIDSLGLIDELLSLDTYKDTVNVPTTLPDVTDEKTHHFVARGLRNPVLVRQDKPYVPNDVELNGQRLTFLTGPNSGGKTSLCKTIAQAQVLAQIGGYIPAEEAKISVADRIFYHAPMINSLQDAEGRFGVEAARTRDIFYQTTPRSLVILDELIEATTYEERLQHSYNILDRFSHIGGNVVLVTHNHELVEKFSSEGKGQFLRVGFNGKNPTHIIIPGISTESHAEDVLERLGFTTADMDKHLKNSGYIP